MPQAKQANTVSAPEKSQHSGHRKRLRERFLNAGPDALADYELLEILLFPARPMGDVKPIAKQLLATFGSFRKVLQAEPSALLAIDGINDAAVVAIKTVTASASRLLLEEAKQSTIIQSWTALLDYCRLTLGSKPHEEFHILFLNHKFGLLADEMQQRGTVNHTPVYPREVVKRALELGAAGLILVHNHPSGDCTPSAADIDMTKQVIAAARTVGMFVHDHLVISDKEHFSFKSHGLL